MCEEIIPTRIDPSGFLLHQSEKRLQIMLFLREWAGLVGIYSDQELYDEFTGPVNTYAQRVLACKRE